MRAFGDYDSDNTASAIKARDHKDATDLVVEPPILIDRAAFNQGINAQYDTHISDDPVSPSLVARGPHAVFTKSKRPQTATDDETWVANQPNPTLNAFDQGDTRTTTIIVEDPVLMRQREGKPGGGKGPLLSNDKSLTLSGSNDQTLFTPVQEPMLIDGTRVNDVRVYDSPVQTLKSRMGTGGNNVPVIGFSHTQSDHQGTEGRTPTLKASGDPVAVAYDEYNDTIGGEVHHALRAGTKQSTGVMIGESVVAPSLTASNDPSRSPQSAEITQQVTAIHQATMAVRRLTPLECERLMGWPDDWTAGQSDTHRYKQCGNGVASPVAQWIAQQLLKLNTP
jgi:hypothetical protein